MTVERPDDGSNTTMQWISSDADREATASGQTVISSGSGSGGNTRQSTSVGVEDDEWTFVEPNCALLQNNKYTQLRTTSIIGDNSIFISPKKARTGDLKPSSSRVTFPPPPPAAALLTAAADLSRPAPAPAPTPTPAIASSSSAKAASALLIVLRRARIMKQWGGTAGVGVGSAGEGGSSHVNVVNSY